MKPLFTVSVFLALPFLCSAQSIVIDDGDAAFSSQLGTGVPILLYHGLDADTGGFYEPSFSPQMQYLKDNNFTTISMDHLVSWIKTGSPTLPQKPIVLNFDDDYITVYTVAYPVLKNLGFIGTNYAHTNFVGVHPGPTTGFDHASWEQLQEMESDGTIITESHTLTHPYLTQISDSQETSEIYDSKIAIEAHLTSKTVHHLAYPFGDYDATTISKVQAAGYDSAVTTVDGLNNRGTPLYELHRYGVNPNTTSDTTLSARFLSSANSATTGSWTTSSAQPGFVGAGYHYSPNGTGTNVATWHFTPTQSGNWTVSARWTLSSNRATNSPYTINYQGGSTTVRVNQKSNNGVYIQLGQFNFFSGTPYTVTLTDDADGYVIADAVKFDYTGISDVHGWTLY